MKTTTFKTLTAKYATQDEYDHELMDEIVKEVDYMTGFGHDLETKWAEANADNFEEVFEEILSIGYAADIKKEEFVC